MPSFPTDETTIYFTSTTVTIAIFLFYYFVIKPWYERDQGIRYSPSANKLSRIEAEDDKDLAIVREMDIDRHADQEATEMVRQALDKEQQLVEEIQTSKSITPVPTTGTETIEATEITVYYGTNRTKTARSDPNEHFWSERLETSKDMNLGYVVVSIPTSHTVGKIERPRFLHAELNEVAKNHVMLIRIEERNRTDFINELNGDLDTKNDTAFVFVHGYCNTFADAARRTAQMAEDIHRDMIPIMFSWPSKGSPKQYPYSQ